MKIDFKEKGFTTIDLGVSMLVMIIFVSIMTSMIYSVYMSSNEARRTATALNYAVDVFEEVGQQSFSSLTPTSVFSYIDNVNIDKTNIKSETINGTQIATAKIGSYDLKLEMTDPYSDGTIKKFKLTINYAVSAKKSESVELERIRTNKL